MPWSPTWPCPAATELRDRTKGRPLTVVVLTALGSSMREASLSAGANAFFEKPIDPSELVRVLAEL